MSSIEPAIQILQASPYVIPDDFKNSFGKITTTLKDFITVERFQKMQRLVTQRSNSVCVVFENTHHAHNISAILRSIESFAFLEIIFLYSNHNLRFRATDAIDRGASQWLLAHRLTSTMDCVQRLKLQGYKIALISLPTFSRTAGEYHRQLPTFASTQINTTAFKDFLGNNKIALVFGSELEGVSADWHSLADCYLYVPMHGFTESLNVSVCAGIILQALREYVNTQSADCLLSPMEQELILEYWISKTCPNAFVYLKERYPELLPWFSYLCQGKFFKNSGDVLAN